MIRYVLTVLLVFIMPLTSAQEVNNSSNLQSENFLQNQEKAVVSVGGGCGPNRPPTMAELLQGVQLVLGSGMLQLPQVQPLVGQQVVMPAIANGILNTPEVQRLVVQQIIIPNLSNPQVIQALANAIAANGIGAGVLEYAYIYNLTAQTIPIEADVPFDTNGIITPGITHAPSSTIISFVNAGVYKVDFSVSGTQPNQFALFLNGTEVPGTVYGSGAGTQQNIGHSIFTVGSGDFITLRNHSSSAAVGLASLIGGTQGAVNASISILKLSP